MGGSVLASLPSTNGTFSPTTFSSVQFSCALHAVLVVLTRMQGKKKEAIWLKNICATLNSIMVLFVGGCVGAWILCVNVNVNVSAHVFYA